MGAGCTGARQTRAARSASGTLALAAVVMVATSVVRLWQPRSAFAQPFVSTVCSFWIKGNPVASRQCRVSRDKGRVFTINYLADLPLGEVKPQTVEVGKEQWQQGSRPECLVYPPTGYTICAR